MEVVNWCLYNVSEDIHNASLHFVYRKDKKYSMDIRTLWIYT